MGQPVSSAISPATSSFIQLLAFDSTSVQASLFDQTRPLLRPDLKPRWRRAQPRSVIDCGEPRCRRWSGRVVLSSAVQSGPRGARDSRAFRTANLYTADPEDRYHDAAIGIGSRSSGRVAHSTGWSFEHHVKTRVHTHLGPSSACRPITGLTRFLAYHPSLRYLADRD